MAVMTMTTSQAAHGAETAAAQDDGRAEPRGTFDTLNPATGQAIAAFPVCGRGATPRGRAGARGRPLVGRARLRASGAQPACSTGSPYLTRPMDELAGLVHEENGKPVADAKLEIILTILHVDWAAKHAQKILGPHRVFSGIAAMNHTSHPRVPPGRRGRRHRPVELPGPHADGLDRLRARGG